jgi:uncharacterized membrane protein
MNSTEKRMLLLAIAYVFLFHSSPLLGAEEPAQLQEEIVSTLEERGISEDFIVILVSALPVLELRGGIPLALYTFDMTFIRSYILAIIGNLIPVIPLLLFLTKLAKILRRYEPFGRLLDWFFNLTRKRGGLIEKYEAVGLVLFVAIPLPVTGAWTGAVASVLFGLRFHYAFPSICLGVLTAGLVVSGTCWLGISLFA